MIWPHYPIGMSSDRPIFSSVTISMGFAFDRKGNQPYDPLEAHVYASLFVIDGMTALDCEPRGTPPTEAESTRKATEMPSHH